MNESRTFGIEIECFAKIDKWQMADRIESNLRDAGFNQELVTAGSYTHMTDNNNFHNWKVEDDASLIHTGNLRSTHPYKMEIKSPVLKGSEGVKKLRTICDTLDGIATVNRYCGLHVHHGMQNLREGESLHNLINGWLRHEDHFMKCLPVSRQSNSYTRKWRSSYSNIPFISNSESVKNWYNEHINDRRVTLNFESYWIRNTVEIRMHSGTVEFDKMVNWLTVTQLYVEKALSGAFKEDPTAVTFEQFIEGLRKEGDITVTRSSGQRTVVAPTEIFRSDAKMKKMPKRGTKAFRIINMLLKDDGVSKQELIDALDSEFGTLDAGKQAKFVAGQLTNMKTTKWGYGFDIVKSPRSKKYRIRRYAEQPVVEQPSYEVVPGNELTEDQKKAIDWFVSRCEYFNNPQRESSSPSETPIRQRRTRSRRESFIPAPATRTRDRMPRSYAQEARMWLDELD